MNATSMNGKHVEKALVAYMLFLLFWSSQKVDSFLRKQRKRRSRILLLAAVLLDLEDDTFRDLLDIEGRQHLRSAFFAKWTLHIS
jgi:hypothetical protein